MQACIFTNMYLSGIHTGIQGGHAVDQMWLKYVKPTGHAPTDTFNAKMLEILIEFSDNHKTFILLNGGEHQNLEALHGLMAKLDLPYQKFEEPGLNNAITAVAIILPERLCDDTAKDIGFAMNSNRMTPELFDVLAGRGYTPYEIEFLKLRSACRLAS